VKILYRIVKCIDSEVSPDNVIFNSSINVITENTARVVGFCPPLNWSGVTGAEGGDFNNFSTKGYMNQFEAATNNPAIAE
jgi:hypothetical protein